MGKLVWDQIGQRFYETGVDQGVLYIPDPSGNYNLGVAWNGLSTVTEKPTGAEPTAKYADNIKYLNLFSAEEFGATLEAYTYPDEFLQYDGLASPSPGVVVGQQPRRTFGLSYRTVMGNDVDGYEHGYKLHMIYGCYASPSEKSYNTINDSPDAISFSWDITTTPVQVSGLKPTSIVVIDSTKVSSSKLEELEDLLYGTVSTDPSLPLPNDIIALFSSILVTPTAPSFNPATNTVTIPSVTGVLYFMDGDPISAGPHVIEDDVIVTASPASGYVFPPSADTEWMFEFEE